MKPLRFRPAGLLLLGFAAVGSAFPVIAEARTLQAGTDCRTLQECVDALPDGGAIKIPLGDYAEGVDIRDRKIKLIGERSKAGDVPTLSPPRDVYGLHGSRARIVMRNLAVRGGNGVGVFSSTLVARGLTVRDSGAHGMSVHGSTFTLINVHILGHVWYGIEATDSIPQKLVHVTIDAPAADGVGMYIDNQKLIDDVFPQGNKEPGVFTDLNIVGHPNGGMVIVGSHFDYTIEKSNFGLNGVFGLYLAQADNTVVKDSTFVFTSVNLAVDPNASGLVMDHCANVLVDGIEASNNQVAGIRAVYSTGTIANSVSTLNKVGLWGVSGADNHPAFANLGNSFSGNSGCFMDPSADCSVILNGDLGVPSTASPLPPPLPH